MDLETFRGHFPSLAQDAHLCTCSEGALSDRVIAAMDAFMTSWRRHGAPWTAWMDEVEGARRAFARLIHADPDEVSVLSCASEGAYQIASTLPLDGRRRTLVTNDLEFPSIAHVWLAQSDARGARVRCLPAAEGLVTGDAYEAAIDDTTALVSVPLASYANGLRLPVARIAAAAHARGARVFVDAYQAAGVLPVDVRALDCDYLVAGALKYLLGAPGIAFLYVRGDRAGAHRPALTGWFGRTNPYAFEPRRLDYAPGARRFDTGTPAIPAAFAARAGLELVGELDPDATWRHVQALAERLQTGLLALGATLYSPRDAALRGPQVTVRTDRPDALAAFLTERRVLASPRGQAVRLSLHAYNNDADVDRAIDAVAGFARRAPLLGTAAGA